MKRDNKGDKTLRVIGILSVTRTLVYFPEYNIVQKPDNEHCRIFRRMET